MAPTGPEVMFGPVRVNGVVARLVAMPDGSARVETWGAEGWTPSEMPFGYLMDKPPASPERMAALGIPDEEGNWNRLACPPGPDIAPPMGDIPASPEILAAAGVPREGATGMPTLEDAILLAVGAHRGQTDKAGRPLILHALRVMFALDSEVERIVGVLHDVIEDTGHTLETLKEMGYPPEVLRALECLTKGEAETYEQFVKRVKTNPLARRVKLADLEDNLDLRRLPELTGEDLERVKKYHRAWLQLTE